MGRIPIYDSNNHDTMEIKLESANAGLWYDKFCNQWESWENGLGENKKKWINTVTGKPVGDRMELEKMVDRRKKLVEIQSGSNILFKTDWRFVTGLGKNHPVENGFTWHHTLGTPYIPGSSVKGIAREYARLLREENKITDKEIISIFGPDDNKEDSNVGSVIFLDAIPNSPVQLSADIMTPHYGPYYSDEKVPGDWHDPTPIPFLTVEKDQEFLFGLIPRNPGAEGNVEKVKDWLIEALEILGAGAKTNVGYGRFEHIRIKSPADQWLVKTSAEISLDLSIITSNPSKAFILKWQSIEDNEFKLEMAHHLKERIISEGNWDGKKWGQLDKLKKALKQYLGE